MLGKESVSMFWGHIKWGQSVTVQARMWVCKFPSGSHHWGQETALESGADNSCSQREEEEMAAPFLTYSSLLCSLSLSLLTLAVYPR